MRGNHLGSCIPGSLSSLEALIATLLLSSLFYLDGARVSLSFIFNDIPFQICHMLGNSKEIRTCNFQQLHFGHGVIIQRRQSMVEELALC